MKVDESNYELLQKISDLTHIDYEIEWKDAENIDGYLDTEGIICMLEDLLMEVEHQKEEYEELEKTIEEDYEPKRFDPYYEYGISENDFH